MNARKTISELRHESTLFLRRAAELRRTGMALVKLAAQLQRESEATFLRSERTGKGTTRRKKR